MRPTSSEPVTSAPRFCRLRRDRARRSRAARPPPSPRRSSRPARGPRLGQVEPERAHAREAAACARARRPRSRCAASSEPRRLTLNAISGLRAPTMTPPTAGSIRAGPKSGSSSPASIRALQPLDAAAPVEGRPAHRRRVDEHRQAERAEPLAERERRLPRALHVRLAAERRSARRRRRRSAGARPRGRAGRSARAPPRPPRRAPRRAPPSSPTTVNTERLWSTSTCTSSSRACPPERDADRVDRRPVAPLGEVRHGLEREHARTLGG